MSNLTIFEAFLITHLIVDFIFQGAWEARNKGKKLAPLLVHSFIYSIGFIPVFYFFQVNYLWLILLFVSHIIIDNQKFVLWILETAKGFKRERTEEPLWILLRIGVDQTLHLIILLIIIFYV